MILACFIVNGQILETDGVNAAGVT